MAIVPTSQGPTVENRPSSFVPQQAQFSPEAFGAGVGGAMQGLAGAIAKDGAQLGAVADHMAYQGALRGAKDADMQAEKGTTDLGFKNLPGFKDGKNSGFFSLSGQDAVDAAPVYAKAMDDLHKQVGDSLGDNPRAQTLFSVQSAQRKAAAYNLASRYSMQQGLVADNNASTARIGAYTDTLATNYTDPAALANFQQVTAGEVGDMARRNGWSQDEAQQHLKLVQSKGYKDAILLSASQGNIPFAAAMFQKLAPSMDAATRVSLAQHMEPLVTGNLADAWVKGEMGTARPAGGNATIADAIHGQESGGRATSVDSIDGAKGGWQIIPATFKAYAQPGEDINNPEHNERVGRRIIDDLSAKAGGDPARIAVGYFSGPGNMSAPGSPLPYKEDRVDGNGFSTSRYVAGVLGRLQGQQKAPAGDASDANPSVHPDFAGMTLKAQEQFGDNPKLLNATTARIHAAASNYNLQTQADRDQIEKSWKDNIAAATSGMDTVSIDEAKIRHVFRPEVADYMVGQFQEAVTAGQLNSALKLANPAQVQAIMTDLSSGLGPKATLDHLRGKNVVGNPGVDAAAPPGQEDAEHYIQRQKALNSATTFLAQRQKMLAADPASYVMQDPGVAEAFKAVNPQDPKTLQAAVAASVSSQKALGVAAEDVRTLTNEQAGSIVKKLHNTTPENGDMGQALNQLHQQYGPAYEGVVKDLAKAGLNPAYQMLAHANLPEQTAVREDLQRALQMKDSLKDKGEFGASVPHDQKHLLQPAIDEALAKFRQTTAPYGDSTTFDSVVLPSVQTLATYYAGKGMSAADAASRAATLVNASYDFDGLLRTPKGKMGEVQSAATTMQYGLKDADLKGTTAAEARRGTWVTNGDDGGVTLMKGTLQGGFMPVRKADGNYVSMPFNNLPKQAVTVPTSLGLGTY